eukprot:COSAG04_NODE_5830_length_1481_cov_1.657742_1_plen_258_part_01
MAAALAERDEDGHTSLDRATACTQPMGAAAGGVRLLVAAGADATAKNSMYGSTALHLAVESGPDDPSLAGVLLGAGCDPAAKISYGWTALDIAKALNKPRMAALLEATAADPEATLAPYRAESDAVKQLVADLGLEAGLAVVASEEQRLAAVRAMTPRYDAMVVGSLESIARVAGRADRNMDEGTRICVAGHGRGAYVGFHKKRIGANEHTIAFDSGETVVVNLKKERWTVKEAKMDTMDPPVPMQITVTTLEQRTIS